MANHISRYFMVTLFFAFACTSNEADIESCTASCDSGKFFDCLSAAEQTMCRSHCTTAGSRARTQFVACQDATLPACDRGCYGHLGLSIAGNGGNGATCGEPETLSCQASCNAIHQHGCFDAATLATCRGRCASTSSVSCNNFSACVLGSNCDVLLDCWTNFH